MSDQSQGPGWWMASDGKWYPPQSAPAPPPPWQAAPWGQPVYSRPSTNGLAIASMVLGILWLYFVGSILALVFGYKARKQIDESAGAETGRGMAIAGIVLGWVGLGLGLGFVVLVVLVTVLGTEANSSFSSTGSMIN